MNIRISDKKGQSAISTNCFTLSAAGIVYGITLTSGGDDAPRIEVGNGFVARNRTPGLGCSYDKETGIVYTAALTKVAPPGRNPYLVLSKPNQDAPILLFVDLMPTEKTHHDSKSSITNIWSGVITNGARAVRQSRQSALLEFTTDDQSSLIFFSNGTVSAVILVEGALRTVSLPVIQAAKERIKNALRQIAECDESDFGLCRKSAILYGIADLFIIAEEYEEARDEITEFLFAQEMSNAVMESLKYILGRLDEVHQFTPDAESSIIGDLDKNAVQP